MALALNYRLAGSASRDEHEEALRTALTEALAAQPVREPYDKTEMNAFAQELYVAKMREGKHGHYEILFHVVHKSIERAHGIGGDK